MKKVEEKKNLCKFFFGLCFIGLILSTYYIVSDMKETRKVKKEFHDLSILLHDEVPNKKMPQLEGKKKEIQNTRVDNLQVLKSKNKDFTGWLYIPNSKINYPVMQSFRDNFYLNHDFYKRESRHGVPFVDKICDTYKQGQNILIYGHHMKDGTMFADLMKYKQRKYYQKHKMIYVYWLNGERQYEVCMVCLADVNKDHKVFESLKEGESKERISDVRERLREKQLYKCDCELNGESLLALVTCEYSGENTRLLVIAKELK